MSSEGRRAVWQMSDDQYRSMSVHTKVHTLSRCREWRRSFLSLSRAARVRLPCVRALLCSTGDDSLHKDLPWVNSREWLSGKSVKESDGFMSLSCATLCRNDMPFCFCQISSNMVSCLRTAERLEGKLRNGRSQSCTPDYMSCGIFLENLCTMTYAC